ncbi:ribonuclease H-like domain-containing protein [Tanacetum coccineum]
MIFSMSSYFDFDFRDFYASDAWFEATKVWEVKAADLNIIRVYCAAVAIVVPNKGISLRFPRLLRVREDKGPEQATSSDQIDASGSWIDALEIYGSNLYLLQPSIVGLISLCDSFFAWRHMRPIFYRFLEKLMRFKVISRNVKRMKKIESGTMVDHAAIFVFVMLFGSDVLEDSIEQLYMAAIQSVESEEEGHQGLGDILQKDTLIWRLEWLKSAAAYAHSHLQAITSEVLVLARTLHDPGAWNMDTSASSYLNSSVTTLNTVFNTCIYLSISVGDGHSIPVTNTGHSILPTATKSLHLNNVLITHHIVKNLISVRQFVFDNNCTIEFGAFSFSVKDFLTRWVLLRCDNTRDLYPVTAPSPIPHAFLVSQHT